MRKKTQENDDKQFESKLMYDAADSTQNKDLRASIIRHIPHASREFLQDCGASSF